MRQVAHAFLTVAVVTSIALAADEPNSGLPVGKAAPGFEVQVATGDDADKKIDYLEKWKDKPVLVIFFGEVTRPAFGLLRQLDKYGRLRQPDGLEVLIVRVTDDAAAAAKHSKVLYDNYEIKSPAGVTREGKAGPKDYELSDQAQTTVLLLDKQHKVVHNFARKYPDDRDFGTIREAIDKLLGPSPVKFP